MSFLGSEMMYDSRPKKFASIVKVIVLYAVEYGDGCHMNIFLCFHLVAVPNEPLALDMWNLVASTINVYALYVKDGTAVMPPIFFSQIL
jgi:hypothetical protein